MKWFGDFKAAFNVACITSFKMQGLSALVDKNWQLKSIKKKYKLKTNLALCACEFTFSRLKSRF